MKRVKEGKGDLPAAMLEQFPDDINLKIWSLLTQSDRVSLLTVNKSCNSIFTPYFYKNLFLNDQRVLSLYQRNYRYPGSFSNYTYLKFEKEGGRFKKTYNSMETLINTLRTKPIYLAYIENVSNSWHLNIDLKLELLNLLTQGEWKAGVLYRGFNLKAFENNLNFPIFNKLITNGEDICLRFRALDIPFLTRLPIHEDLTLSYNFNDYFETISDTFSKFTYTFPNLRSLTVHFNPLLMKFCKNKKLKLKYLCLNIREKEFTDSMKYLNEDLTLNSWDDVLDVSYLKTLELVSWLPNPNAAFLKDFELITLLRSAKNLEILKTYSFPYFSKFVEVILNECESLKQLRLDLFDPTQVFTRLFMEKHSQTQKYNSLFNLESLHLETITVSYRDPDFLIYLLRDHPQFNSLRSKLPCDCKDCSYTLTNIILAKIFIKPPFIEYDAENKTIQNYSAFYLFFKEMMYVMPHKSSFENLFVQYGIVSFEQLKEHLNNLYSCELSMEDLKNLYHFIIHFNKRGIRFMFSNFPNLRYLNLNDLPVLKDNGTQGFKPCFEFEDLVETN